MRRVQGLGMMGGRGLVVLSGGLLLLSLAGCAGVSPKQQVAIEVGADGAVEVTWVEEEPFFPDWGCAPNTNEFDPDGAGSSWFAQIGVDVAMDGWANPNPAGDICLFSFQFRFSTLQDWNQYVSEWVGFLAAGAPDGTYFYPVPTPGALTRTVLEDGSVEVTLSTEVLLPLWQMTQPMMGMASPGSSLDVAVTLECPVIVADPPASVEGNTATWDLPVGPQPPVALTATTDLDCVA